MPHKVDQIYLQTNQFMNQQLLKFHLKTAAGAELKQDVLHTINVIP